MWIWIFFWLCNLILANLFFHWNYWPDLLLSIAVLFLVSDLWGLRFCWVFQLCFLPISEKSILSMFLTLFSAQIRYWKSRIINWNLFLVRVYSARMKLWHAVFGMIQYMENGTEKVLPSCPHLIFSVGFTVYSKKDLRLVSWIFAGTMPCFIKEKEEDP